jgi:Domain of unknown function (DUF4349)/Putative zinc-finger
MKATDHPLAPERLMAFVDSELPNADEALLASHLETCAGCRALQTELRESSARLRRWTVPPLSSEAASRIADRLAQAEPGKRSRRPLARRFVWLAAVAVPMVLVLLSVPGLEWRGHVVRDSFYLSDQLQHPVVPRASAIGWDGASKNLPSLEKGREADVLAGDLERVYPAAPMIARTAELVVLVKDLKAARTGIDQILARHHGYAVELAVSGEHGSAPTLEASLKVPSEELAAALAELKSLGRVKKEAQKGEEVTAAYVDLTARLANSKETERRLVEILRTRTGKVSEVLEVEEQIASTRQGIERMEAERKTMETRVSFATVSVSASEEYKEELQSAAPAGTRLRNALVRGFEHARESGVGALAWAVSLLPSLLLWGAVLFFPLRWGWRRSRASLSQASSVSLPKIGAAGSKFCGIL